MKVRTGGTDHLPLHCLWAYGKGRSQLSPEEHAHVAACERCSRALEVCRQENNFGGVLRELARAADDISGEKPKLKTLYVVSGPISLIANTVRRRTD